MNTKQLAIELLDFLSDDLKLSLAKELKKRIKYTSFHDVKCIESVYEILGLDESFYSIPQLTPDEIAYRKLKAATKVINWGWEPDCSSKTQEKWFIWIDGYHRHAIPEPTRAGFDHSYCPSSASLGLESHEKCIHVVKYFFPLYDSFFASTTPGKIKIVQP